MTILRERGFKHLTCISKSNSDRRPYIKSLLQGKALAQGTSVCWKLSPSDLASFSTWAFKHFVSSSKLVLVLNIIINPYTVTLKNFVRKKISSISYTPLCMKLIRYEIFSPILSLFFKDTLLIIFIM